MSGIFWEYYRKLNINRKAFINANIYMLSIQLVGYIATCAGYHTGMIQNPVPMAVSWCIAIATDIYLSIRDNVSQSDKVIAMLTSPGVYVTPFLGWLAYLLDAIKHG